MQLLRQDAEVSRRRDVSRRQVGITSERLAPAGEVQPVHGLRETLPEDARPEAQSVEGEALPARDAPGGDGLPNARRLFGPPELEGRSFLSTDRLIDTRSYGRLQ